jgi:hypothetical protein
MTRTILRTHSNEELGSVMETLCFLPTVYCYNLVAVASSRNSYSRGCELYFRDVRLLSSVDVRQYFGGT